MSKIKCFTIFFILLLAGLNAAARVDNSTYKQVREPTKDLHGFALAVQDYMNAGQTDYFRARIDYSVLTDSTLDLMPDAPQLDELKKPGEFDQLIKMAVLKLAQGIFSKEVEWTYLNYRRHKGNHYLLYRVSDDVNLDYLEVLVEPKNGGWLVTDWYAYSTELWASEAMAFSFGTAFKAAAGTSGPRLADFIHSVSKSQPTLEKAFLALNADEKRIPAVISIYITRSANTSQEALITSLENVDAVIHGSSHYLSLAGLYGHRQQYEKVIAAVEKLEYNIGPDVQLEFMLVENWAALGQRGKAIAGLVGTLENQPDNLLVYYTTLAFLVQEKMYREGTLVLDVLHGYNETYASEDVLQNVDGMGPFLQSSDYKSWRTSLVGPN